MMIRRLSRDRLAVLAGILAALSVAVWWRAAACSRADF
jgi:hypothetical protein